MANVKIKLGLLSKHKQDMRALAAKTVKVGIQADAGEYPDGTKVIDVAIWNHFGTSSIPARPFLTAAVRRYREEIKATMSTLAAAVSRGEILPEVAHMKAGLAMTNYIRQTMREGPWTPLSPETIKRKGHSRPLFDQHILVNKIRPEIV